MNLIVIGAVLGAMLAAIVTVLAKRSERNIRIAEAKLRAAKRQIKELVNNRDNSRNKPPVLSALAEKTMEDIIAKLLDDNPDLAGDPEFIELWASTEPDKLKR